MDSWSARISYNPLRELSMQVSYGDLKSPEQLEPDVRIRRTTASATYHLNRGVSQWATTLAYGQNRKTGPATDRSEPGWLLESTCVLRDTHTVFGRAEQVRTAELFAEGQPLRGQEFQVRKLSVGYMFDEPTAQRLADAWWKGWDRGEGEDRSFPKMASSASATACR